MLSIATHLLGFASSLIRLSAQIRRGRRRVLEEAGKDWLKEGAEDDLGATARKISPGTQLKVAASLHTQFGVEPSRGPR